jgi:hypothetical protein
VPAVETHRYIHITHRQHRYPCLTWPILVIICSLYFIDDLFLLYLGPVSDWTELDVLIPSYHPLPSPPLLSSPYRLRCHTLVPGTILHPFIFHSYFSFRLSTNTLYFATVYIRLLSWSRYTQPPVASSYTEHGHDRDQNALILGRLSSYQLPTYTQSLPHLLADQQDVCNGSLCNDRNITSTRST